LPLGGLFTGYLSDEILALHPGSVKRFFGNNFSMSRARVISRRGIAFRGKKIMAKISAPAAELRANKFQFSRARLFSGAEIAPESARKARLQGAPKNYIDFRLPGTR
jgi:hypothetical protein